MTWLDEPEHPIFKEFVGIAPPPGVHLPTGNELLGLCSREPPRGYIEYPAESPVFFIKFGWSVYWNEVVAQDKAYCELRNLGSSVRVPSIFYACQTEERVVIVMECIHGKTVEQLLKDCKDNEVETERMRGIVAHCLSELIRIPVAAGSRPAAVDSSKIRHDVFDMNEAPRHYENADQLEKHINYVCTCSPSPSPFSCASYYAICQTDDRRIKVFQHSKKKAARQGLGARAHDLPAVGLVSGQLHD